MRISKYKYFSEILENLKFTAASACAAKLVLGETYKVLPRTAELEPEILLAIVSRLETEAHIIDYS